MAVSIVCKILNKIFTWIIQYYVSNTNCNVDSFVSYSFMDILVKKLKWL